MVLSALGFDITFEDDTHWQHFDPYATANSKAIYDAIKDDGREFTVEGGSCEAEGSLVIRVHEMPGHLYADKISIRERKE